MFFILFMLFIKISIFWNFNIMIFLKNQFYLLKNHQKSTKMIFCLNYNWIYLYKNFHLKTRKIILYVNWKTAVIECIIEKIKYLFYLKFVKWFSIGHNTLQVFFYIFSYFKRIHLMSFVYSRWIINNILIWKFIISKINLFDLYFLMKR